MTAEEQLIILVKAQDAVMDHELAQILLRRAQEDILGLCNREYLPSDSGLEATAAELALIYFNRIGGEGERQHVEGDISYAFELGIPRHIERRLQRHNKGQVI